MYEHIDSFLIEEIENLVEQIRCKEQELEQQKEKLYRLERYLDYVQRAINEIGY